MQPYVVVVCEWCFFFFFKQKTAYEMRISDWSSDVCSSDLDRGNDRPAARARHDRGQHAFFPQSLHDADMEEKEAARPRQQQRRAAVAMLRAAEEIALFVAGDAARGGDIVQ